MQQGTGSVAGTAQHSQFFWGEAARVKEGWKARWSANKGRLTGVGRKEEKGEAIVDFHEGK